MTKKNFVTFGICMAGWITAIFGAAHFIDLWAMPQRFVVAFIKAFGGEATVIGAYVSFGAAVVAAMVAGLAGEFASVRTSKNKEGTGFPAVLGVGMVVALLVLLHLGSAVALFPGHFYDFRGNPVEICSLPVFVGALYLALRLSFIGDLGGTRSALRRGVTIITDPKKALAAFQKTARGLGEPGALIHPKLRLPSSLEAQHVLLIGAPGAGKTQVLFPLLADIVARAEPVVLYDFKGDYTAAFGGHENAVILSPFDARGAAWDIAADLDTELRIREFATILIPDTGAKDKFFKIAAQDVLAAVFTRLKTEKGGGWTIDDVVKILNDKAEMIESCKIYRPAALHAIGDGKNNQAIGVFGELRTSTLNFEFLGRAWAAADRKLSVNRWVKDLSYRNKSKIVIIQGNNEYTELDGFLTSMLFSLLIKQALTLPDSRERKIWAFLDEFGNLPAISGIDRMLTAVRSKGLRVVAAIQNFSQVEVRYSAASSKDFLGSFATVLAGRCVDETAKRLSSAFGKNEIERDVLSESKSHGGENGSRLTDSVGKQIVVESALLDTAFTTIELPNLKRPATFWVSVAGWSIGKLLYPVKPTPELYPPYIEAKWLRRE